jgi:hypothetical protein
LPVWLALTVQVPALTKVMVAPLVPLAVQTVGVVVVKVTASPDDAVAATVMGDCASVAAGRGSNEMLCDSLVFPR